MQRARGVKKTILPVVYLIRVAAIFFVLFFSNKIRISSVLISNNKIIEAVSKIAPVQYKTISSSDQFHKVSSISRSPIKLGRTLVDLQIFMFDRTTSKTMFMAKPSF